ncbi:hypothetical protein D3C72_909790 [compost metagenome]
MTWPPTLIRLPPPAETTLAPPAETTFAPPADTTKLASIFKRPLSAVIGTLGVGEALGAAEPFASGLAVPDEGLALGLVLEAVAGFLRRFGASGAPKEVWQADARRLSASRPKKGRRMGTSIREGRTGADGLTTRRRLIRRAPW